MATITEYHTQLAEAGMLFDAIDLQPTSKGWRIEWSAGRKIVTDGTFAETKELIAGFMIMDVPLREQALEWAERFLNPVVGDGAIGTRQVCELEEFAPPPGPRAACRARG